jgi:hypothetical protein
VNREEYLSLNRLDPGATVVHVDDLTGPDRTLLYGFTVNRDTWHVYLRAGRIHRLVYTARGVVLDHRAQESWDAVRLVPDKRTYPESTDLGFAQLLKRKGVFVSYLPFDEARYEKVKDNLFHGRIAD